MANTMNCSVREMRKRDVINTFFENLKKLRKKNPKITLGEVVKLSAQCNAPRFYATFENARRFVSLLIRNKKLPIKNPNKVSMYKEIYRRYKKRMSKGECRYIVIEEILEEPAPSFYLDVETFQGILYKTVRKHDLSLA